METILTQNENGVFTITLNRPEVKNAFNDILIREVTETFEKVNQDSTIRVVVIRGSGDAFCAGGDLNWMRSFLKAGHEENKADAYKLAKMIEGVNSCVKPVIAVVHGAAMGGGVGLISSCDMVVAVEEAQFGLSEVKLGLVPAVISPFVISKIGASWARRLFLTGERFTALRALQIGLVHEVVAKEDLEDAVGKIIKELLTSGPEAVATGKKLISYLRPTTTSEILETIAGIIANMRISAEGQEGMSAFLEKRRASWHGSATGNKKSSSS